MDIESRVRQIVAEELVKFGLTPDASQTPAPPNPMPVTAMPTPAGAPVPPATMPPTPAAPPPLGGPPVGVPAAAVPPAAVPPAAIPAGPPGAPTAAVPGAPGAPVATAPAAAPLQAVPTLDDIKALANDFHRAHPERAAEVVGVLAGVGATKMDDIPAAQYPIVFKQIKEIAGVQ